MWYVIQVRAGREDYVTDRCRQMIASGEEVFVPKTIFLRRFHGSDEKLTVPMFPGYVFFDTDNIDIFFYKLKKIYGFTKILEIRVTVSASIIGCQSPLKNAHQR